MCIRDSDNSYGASSSGRRYFVGSQIDDPVSANRPYLEYTTGTSEETVVHNANFFGTNF